MRAQRAAASARDRSCSSSVSACVHAHARHVPVCVCVRSLRRGLLCSWPSPHNAWPPHPPLSSPSSRQACEWAHTREQRVHILPRSPPYAATTRYTHAHSLTAVERCVFVVVVVTIISVSISPAYLWPSAPRLMHCTPHASPPTRIGTHPPSFSHRKHSLFVRGVNQSGSSSPPRHPRDPAHHTLTAHARMHASSMCMPACACACVCVCVRARMQTGSRVLVSAHVTWCVLPAAHHKRGHSCSIRARASSVSGDTMSLEETSSGIAHLTTATDPADESVSEEDARTALGPQAVRSLTATPSSSDWRTLCIRPTRRTPLPTLKQPCTLPTFPARFPMAVSGT
jgi:hypothetical protein